jgi:hypothetical protein
VVWSKFPYDQRPGLPAVDPHPALVFAASEYKADHWAVQVAYGTSNLKTDSRAYDFRIQNFRAMQYAGLNQATRFDLDQIKWLMWDDDWFASPNPKIYETPVIGCLLEDQQDRLRRLLRRREAKGLPLPFKLRPAE